MLIAKWPLLLGLAIICYWPGLYGGFVFDDTVNILRNDSLKVSSGDFDQFWAAAVSGHAGPLGRPVALLTFALNYYFAGSADPFQFKLTNLAIHLATAVLVGCLAQLVCQALGRKDVHDAPTKMRASWAGWIVALLWVLHPLNLTGVLYVVQRMTSLCTLFGVAALVIFAWYRFATWSEKKLGSPILWGWMSAVAIACCLALSVLSKESGAIFTLLLLWIEWRVFRFQFHGKEIRIGKWRLCIISAWILAFLVAYVCIFRLPSMAGPAAYANREFTMLERCLTEARVLVFYLRMMIVPIVSELSLYHDDFEVSHSLWSPPSTALAIALLLLISVATWALRKRFDVLLFGWGWFLISHALESTIFPLELVYEHRNYFAMIGPLLILPMALERVETAKLRQFLWVGLLVYAGLLAFMTHVRSLQWSHPADWAALEASNKPASMRANYELARVYMVLMNTTGEDRFGKLADEALIRSTQTASPGVLPFMGRIQLAYLRGNMPTPQLISEVKQRFSTEKYRNVNTAVLTSLVNCQVEERCAMADHDVLDVLNAALENPLIPRSERAEVLKLIAQYQINRIRDLSAGINFIRQSIDVQDKAPSRIMLAQALAIGGRFDEALSQLEQAEMMDERRAFVPKIARERSNIRSAMAR